MLTTEGRERKAGGPGRPHFLAPRIPGFFLGTLSLPELWESPPSGTHRPPTCTFLNRHKNVSVSWHQKPLHRHTQQNRTSDCGAGGSGAATPASRWPRVKETGHGRF